MGKMVSPPLPSLGRAPHLAAWHCTGVMECSRVSSCLTRPGTRHCRPGVSHWNRAPGTSPDTGTGDRGVLNLKMWCLLYYLVPMIYFWSSEFWSHLRGAVRLLYCCRQCRQFTCSMRSQSFKYFSQSFKYFFSYKLNDKYFVCF